MNLLNNIYINLEDEFQDKDTISKIYFIYEKLDTENVNEERKYYSKLKC